MIIRPSDGDQTSEISAYQGQIKDTTEDEEMGTSRSEEKDMHTTIEELPERQYCTTRSTLPGNVLLVLLSILVSQADYSTSTDEKKDVTSITFEDRPFTNN